MRRAGPPPQVRSFCRPNLRFAVRQSHTTRRAWDADLGPLFPARSCHEGGAQPGAHAGGHPGGPPADPADPADPAGAGWQNAVGVLVTAWLPEEGSAGDGGAAATAARVGALLSWGDATGSAGAPGAAGKSARTK